MTPPLFPVGLVVAGRACLVVGGGAVAARKATSLAECGARVTVVAPEIAADLLPRDVRVELRPYRLGEAADYRLVIAATDDPAVNARVFDDAEAAGVWCNVADDPGHCSVTLPAVARRGPVTVTVATDGTSPALAALLRDRVAEHFLTPDVEHLARAAGDIRIELQAVGRPTSSVDWRTLLSAALDAESLVRRPPSLAGDSLRRTLSRSLRAGCAASDSGDACCEADVHVGSAASVQGLQRLSPAPETQASKTA